MSAVHAGSGPPREAPDNGDGPTETTPGGPLSRTASTNRRPPATQGGNARQRNDSQNVHHNSDSQVLAPLHAESNGPIGAGAYQHTGPAFETVSLGRQSSINRTLGSPAPLPSHAPQTQNQGAVLMRRADSTLSPPTTSGSSLRPRSVCDQLGADVLTSTESADGSQAIGHHGAAAGGTVGRNGTHGATVKRSVTQSGSIAASQQYSTDTSATPNSPHLSPAASSSTCNTSMNEHTMTTLPPPESAAALLSGGGTSSAAGAVGSSLHLRSSSRVSAAGSIRNGSGRERQRTTLSVRSLWSIGSRHTTSGGGELVAPRVYSVDIRDYELLNDIGSVDDISYLYLAKHLPTNELVALKYTDLTISPTFELIEEVTQTVHNTMSIWHRNILPYFTTFVENERLWTVTLPCKGGSCRQILQSHCPGGIAETAVATILKYVLRALVYLHDNLCVHNAICSSNILLDSGGEVRLTGVRQMVSLVTQGENRRSVWTLLGDNIEWAAPEIIAQNSNYNCKADLYSLGITALELAFGKTPFDDWPPLKILYSKINYDLPAFPNAASRGLSKQFYRFVQLCTQKDPKWRPTARDLLEHPFLKQAKSERYLEKHLIRAHGIHKKHDAALMASASGGFASQSKSRGATPSASQSGTLTRPVTPAAPHTAPVAQLDESAGSDGLLKPMRALGLYERPDNFAAL